MGRDALAHPGPPPSPLDHSGFYPEQLEAGVNHFEGKILACIKTSLILKDLLLMLLPNRLNYTLKEH